MLACALALRMPFKTQTVSLVGFSLGTQVVKSCLKTLHEIYNHPSEPPLGHSLPSDIIQSATLMGGACHFSKNIHKYKNIFQYTVNGPFKNVFSKNDRILYLYVVSELQLNSIGRNPICLRHEGFSNLLFDRGPSQAQVGNPQNRRDERSEGEIIEQELVQNFDISKNVVSKSGGMGHSDYMERVRLMEILMNIDLK